MQQFILFSQILFFFTIFYKLNCIINNFHRSINFSRNWHKKSWEVLLREIFLSVKDFFDNNKKIKLEQWIQKHSRLDIIRSTIIGINVVEAMRDTRETDRAQL